MKFRLAIDASRNRSGGAVAHILGLLKYSDPAKFGIVEIHIWTHSKLARQIPKYPWLILHNPKALERGLISQLVWQFFRSASEFKDAGCNMLLNTDAGSVGRFSPSVTMSRDMLSYEPGEMQRYGISIARVRLLFLRFVQNWSLKRATGAVFLTNYARDVIQKSTGILTHTGIIPHGVNELFRGSGKCNPSLLNQANIEILYVSNTAFYKHQWHVVRACRELRFQGVNINLSLVGGGTGAAQKKLEREIANTYPNSWIKQLPFLDPTDLKKMFSLTDIFLFASSCENMPNTLLEGMAAGLSIVCSNRGPMPEVLGDGGVYFDPEEPNSIINAIRLLISDNKLRLQLAKIAYDRAIQFSWKRCADETFTFLSETYVRSVNGNR